MDWKKRMNEAMRYIEDNLCKTIDYCNLSRYMNCSETEFRRLFSFLTGIPLSEYIRNRKLTKAAEELLLGHKVIEVAMAYGYDSHAAFSRAFKKKHGVSPSKIEKSMIDPYPQYEFRMILVEGLQLDNKNSHMNIVGSGEVGYAIKTDKEADQIMHLNNSFWSNRGNELIGTTALPKYGAFLTEEKLNLFEEISGKKILEIGCGSGHSLAYVAEKNAKELWGIDISEKQISIAKSHLKTKGFDANLLCLPMEVNEHIPTDYFDFVYSVYGIGWTTDLEKTFKNIHSYLKEGGQFIFSWSHPIHKCVSLDHGQLVFKKNYYDEAPYEGMIDGEVYSLIDRKLSTYINTLVSTGFMIEQLIEESDESLINAYGKAFGEKARMLPVTFVIKAKKI